MKLADAKVSPDGIKFKDAIFNSEIRELSRRVSLLEKMMMYMWSEQCPENAQSDAKKPDQK